MYAHKHVHKTDIFTHEPVSIILLVISKEDWIQQEFVLLATHAFWVPAVDSHKTHL
jgi:hypothetical protein